jgi:hypothetical protein
MTKTYNFPFMNKRFGAEVTPGVSVKVWFEDVEKTFKVGDTCSYLGTERFHGTIEKIGPKTVTIRNFYNHRISIQRFAFANT